MQQRARQGLPGASDKLAAVIQRLYGPLLMFARGLCAEPEDVVQETFLELQKHPELLSFDSEEAQAAEATRLRAWLFRTARHRALNWQRSRRRRQHHELNYSEQKTWFATVSHSHVEADEASSALEALSAEIRETVIARLWGNLTLEEIAVLTEVSISTAQRRYIRGLEQLRQRLDRDPKQTNDALLPSTPWK